MAHPVRRASAEAVQASLDRPTPIVWDPVAKPSKDKMQRWRNGRNAWQTAYDADPAADWCLVLQDDVRVADNLLAGIEAALEHLGADGLVSRSEEHTSELQSRENLVCRLLLEKKKKDQYHIWPVA